MTVARTSSCTRPASSPRASAAWQRVSRWSSSSSLAMTAAPRLSRSPGPAVLLHRVLPAATTLAAVAAAATEVAAAATVAVAAATEVAVATEVAAAAAVAAMAAVAVVDMAAGAVTQAGVAMTRAAMAAAAMAPRAATEVAATERSGYVDSKRPHSALWPECGQQAAMSATGCAAGLAIRITPRPHWCQQPCLLLAGTLLLPSVLCRMYRYGSRSSAEAPCSLDGGPLVCIA